MLPCGCGTEPEAPVNLPRWGRTETRLNPGPAESTPSTVRKISMFGAGAPCVAIRTRRAAGPIHNFGEHQCPARSRIESVDCPDQAILLGCPMLGAPVKWAFSRKASRSKSVEFGKGSPPGRAAYGRWPPGRKARPRPRFASSRRSRWCRKRP